MEFVAQMMTGEADPVRWLRQREQEGWHGVSIGDHLTALPQPYQHVWVTIGQWAASPSSIQLATAFGNNLIRSPVEFAHAALTAQAASGGRFEAGLGAGWAAADVQPAGLYFPGSAERARRYREAAHIVRDLLTERCCEFHGEFYDVDVDELPVLVDEPPPLVVAVGGPWVTDHVAPIGDRVEIVPFAHVLRGGTIDFSAWPHGTPGDVAAAADRARRANPTAPLQLGVFVAAGTGTGIRAWADRFEGGPLHGLAGEPNSVAATLHLYAKAGISRCTLSALTPDTYTNLAPLLNAH